MNILDKFKCILFCFHIFVARRSIDILDPENQPRTGKITTRSGALGLAEDFWHQKYENEKKAFKII